MDEAVIKRIQPNSKDAEQALINAMLVDTDKIVEIAAIVTKDDFYYGEYGLFFEAMVALSNEDKPVDLLTVSSKLKQMDAPESICNMEYVRDIIGGFSIAANAEEYAQEVRDLATLRKVIKFTEKTTELCYAGKTQVEDLLNNTEKELFDIIQRRNKGDDYTPINEIIPSVLDTIEASSKREGKITGVPTGFIDLDEKLTGLHAEELILIAARPAMGKTAFALNIAQNVAMKSRIPCVVFSLEMSKEQLATRLMAMDSMVDSQMIRTGQLADSDWEKLIDSTGRVADMPMYIDDTPGITIPELRSKCRKLKQQADIGLIIIDYLQLMSGSGRRESRQQEISEISRSLKILAKELKVPIIALSQLNRAADSREDHKPVMSDLRESGAIEQDADVIMFIYRDDYYNKESTKPGIADIIVAKQRNGSTGPVELVWLGKYTKFGNKERRERIR